MFWIAYVLTRPLGGSIGDYMSSGRDEGGLGIGTTMTSVVFLGVILLVVAYLSLSGVDVLDRQGNRRVTVEITD